MCDFRVIRGHPGTSLRFRSHAPRVIFWKFSWHFWPWSQNISGAIHSKNRSSLVVDSLMFQNHFLKVSGQTDKTRRRSPAHKVDIGGQFFENFHEKLMFPKSVQDHSGKVVGPSGHQKTSKGWQNIHLGASGKMFKNWPKTSSFEGFWDLIFSNFPCWRMCCLRRASR